VEDAGGKVVAKIPASPDAAMQVRAAIGEGSWRITALDRAGSVHRLGGARRKGYAERAEGGARS